MDQNPQNSVHLQKPMNQLDFQQRYWFTSLQMVTVLNPLDTDYPFMVEMRHFIIRANSKERFPGVIANVYLDQMSKILAQNDNKLEFMSDPAMMRVFFDKLIEDVENLVPEYNPVPAYLRNVAPSAQMEAPDETPPWQQNMERARNVTPNIQDASPELPKQPDNPKPKSQKEETKEFEYQNVKYKMVVDKNGNEMYFKDGRRTDAAEYGKAASML